MSSTAHQDMMALLAAHENRETEAVMTSARAEAATIVGAAHREARDRMHRDVTELRRTLRLQVGQAEAALQTATRVHQQRCELALLQAAWPTLEAALRARWEDARARASWVDMVVEQARTTLPPGGWELLHPPSWPQAERDALLRRLADEPGGAPGLNADPAIEAGVLLRSGGASIDATLRGILVDRRSIEAALLARLHGELPPLVSVRPEAIAPASAEDNQARVTWISGPVLRAQARGRFRMREAVSVGETRLLGEVIRIDGAEITVQVYEDTTGMRPGMTVFGSGQPLSVPLGPGLLGNILDGLLRPLQGGATPYVEPGMRAMAAGVFPFQPQVQPGVQLAGGSVFGTTRTTDGREYPCLLPPDASGEVLEVAVAGDYEETATLLWLRTPAGETREVALRQPWPVRTPRPIAERLANDQPLLSGQRVVDSLFPLAPGGRAAIPGGFGTGKTILLETLAKWCSADVIVYVGCGERGNEIASVLEEFPTLEDPRTGRRLMERTVIIANTSNMPVSAREASIYTGVTVAEYFRDHGLHVALMADSTSRWAEALREVSGRLGELPGEGAYPAYLSSRLAEFYERAGRVRTLHGGEGSVTIIGSVSPPSGDFSEPVTAHTKRYIRSYWALDVKRAQARFYPAIHPLQSYSEDVTALSPWWQTAGSPRWPELRRRFLSLLEEQARLDRMARIIGKDAMPARQQVVLLCAELVNDAFLRQSAFSMVDRYASPQRQLAMMNVLARFAELAEQAVTAGASVEAITTMPVYRRVVRMSEDIPEQSLPEFKELEAALEQAFAGLAPGTGGAGGG